MFVLAGAIAFIVAFTLVVLELITSSYPRVGRFLFSIPLFYAYVLPYAVLSTCAFALIDHFEAQKIIDLGPLNHDLAQAITLGIVTKSLVNLKLFSVRLGAETLPVGPDILFKIYEPWLLGSIELEMDNRIISFATATAKPLPTPEAIDKFKQNIPPSYPPDLKGALQVDVEAMDTVHDVFHLFIISFGIAHFTRVFR